MLKVLVAVDGSLAAAEALDLAIEILAGKQAAVTVLHVIPRHLTYGRGGPVVVECYDPDDARLHAQALLDSAAQRLREHGIGPVVKLELETGDPADLILAAAEQSSVDLIVLGSQGLSAVRRFLHGSVSTKVTSHAHCAVLVVHPRQNAAPVPVQEERELATV